MQRIILYGRKLLTSECGIKVLEGKLPIRTRHNACTGIVSLRIEERTLYYIISSLNTKDTNVRRMCIVLTSNKLGLAIMTITFMNLQKYNVDTRIVVLLLVLSHKNKTMSHANQN